MSRGGFVLAYFLNLSFVAEPNEEEANFIYANTKTLTRLRIRADGQVTLSQGYWSVMWATPSQKTCGDLDY